MASGQPALTGAAPVANAVILFGIAAFVLVEAIGRIGTPPVVAGLPMLGIGAPGVLDAHDLHAWTLTSGISVVSAHVIVAPDADPAGVLDELCACLAEDFDFEHSTIQLETADRRRLEHRTYR